MTIYCSSIEGKYDICNNPIEVWGVRWKHIKLWLVKISLEYEYYTYCGDKTGKNLSTIRITKI